MADTKAKPFYFKEFTIEQDHCPMKVGTDGILLGAWADVEGAERVLDIGAGTGVIAIMLGQRTRSARIDGIEIDPEACRQAEANMQSSPWADRLQAFNMAVQDFARTHTHSYDLIVSNPPFFSGGTFSANQDRNSVRHTIKLPHGELLTAVRTLLAPSGKFCVVLPLIEGLRFQELAESYKLYCTRATEVRPKAQQPVERLLLQFEHKQRQLTKDHLVIQREKNNDWTEAYRLLTGAFYLKM